MGSIEPPFSIAIIGSGIGGLALAIGLVKQNVQYTVLESAPRFDAVGAGIGLGPNALKAMELMDDKFAKMYNDIKVGNTSPDRVHEQFEILGAEEGFGTLTGWNGGSVSHPKFTRSSAHRKALLQVMESLIPKRTLQFNRRVVAIHQEEGKQVAVELADGDILKYDAVIGCDGIKGMTRQVVLGSRYPEEVPAKYCNTYVYRGIAPMKEAKEIIGSYAGDAKWFMREGRGCAIYPISNGQEVNIVVFIQDKNPWVGDRVAREVTREEMVSEFTGFDDRLRRLLDVSYTSWPYYS
jgi:salicylate hydroxylase